MSGRRIALGIGANIYGKLVVALTQLALVPILAIHWGLPIYGCWVLLSTVPSFLAVSDFGFSTAASTQMTILVAQDDRAAAVRVFQSAWKVILFSSSAMMALALLAAYYAPSAVLPSAAGFHAADARLALGMLLVYSIVALQGSILLGGFRCAGLFAVGTFWSANTILLESLGVIAAVVAGGTPMHAALALLVCRSLALVVQAWLLRVKVPWLKIGLSQATRAEAKALIAPALGVAAIPLGQAAFLQGTAIALGAAAGETAVPAFTAVRTLSRIGLQMAQLVVHAIMPEYSAAVARQDRRGQAAMTFATLACAAALLVPFAVLLALFGRPIVALWTHGVIHPSLGLILAMALTVVLGGIWNPLSNLILAMNLHARFSYPFLILAALTMPVSYLLSLRFGPTGAALSMVMMDAAMCFVIVWLGRTMFVSIGEMRDAGDLLVHRARMLLRRRPT